MATVQVPNRPIRARPGTNNRPDCKVAAESNGRVVRRGRLRWVPIAKVRIPPHAQRYKINWGRVHQIAANLDLEQLGSPTCSRHVDDGGDEFWFCLDGMHRIEALKEHGYGDQQIQCLTYEDLSPEEEAEIFLKLNDTLTVSAYDKFVIGLHAGRQTEREIDQIVRAQGLVISRRQTPGGICAVETLRKVYHAAGVVTLGRCLRIIRDGFGDAGLEAIVIEGIGLLCQRYDGRLPGEATVAARLGGVNGGVNGLLNKAGNLRRQTGNLHAHCVAAAAVEILNAGRANSKAKLPPWWKS